MAEMTTHSFPLCRVNFDGGSSYETICHVTTFTDIRDTIIGPVDFGFTFMRREVKRVDND